MSVPLTLMLFFALAGFACFLMEGLGAPASRWSLQALGWACAMGIVIVYLFAVGIRL